MLGAFIAVVETCGDIGVLSPFSARKSCCGSSYHINLEVDHSIPYGSVALSHTVINRDASRVCVSHL